MKLEIPDEHIPLVIRALEHYYAYTRAVQREDLRYQQVADFFKRPPTASKMAPHRQSFGPARPAKRKRA